ncbi:MAG: VOC family protein [Chloroflexi bacterium]|nr:MAG: VOC family protein [Chloroflexota bacterium]
MSPPPINEQITFLYTADLTASAKFYEDVLGLELVRDQRFCRIYRVSPSGYLGICEREGAPVQPATWDERSVIFTIVTDDVDGWYTHLKARGVAFEKHPTHFAKINIYHFVIRDPNNYIIEVQQFLD